MAFFRKFCYYLRKIRISFAFSRGKIQKLQKPMRKLPFFLENINSLNKLIIIANKHLKNSKKQAFSWETLTNPFH